MILAGFFVVRRNCSARFASSRNSDPIKITAREGANCLLARLYYRTRMTVANVDKETDMSVKGEIKEGAGFVKEEMNEHGKSPESQRKAQEGRDLRNEGRVEDGKPPKTTKPGTGHPEK
jgi:hypothetical protein